MANKRRPKKAHVPYRRYVYRLSFTAEPNSSDDDDEDTTEDDVNSAAGAAAATDTNGKTAKEFQNSAHIISTYVLTQLADTFKGKMWPRSQFEKIDVLAIALALQDPVNIAAAEERARALALEAAHICAEEAKLMKLPVELFAYVLEIVYFRGKLRPKHLRVCKLWYLIAFPLLYRRPQLKALNFYQFVDLISSNKRVGDFIHELDLANVIQSGKNAFVQKLLKRSKKNLEVFVAPQASFGLAPLLSLKNCLSLKVLDLRLVSETLNLSELFRSISSLENLTSLSFPRSSIAITDYLNVLWPPRISYLRLSGGISDDFLFETSFPQSITQLEFAHCPQIKEFGFHQFIRKLGTNLKNLKVQYPMPGLKEGSLDCVFNYCPNLVVLEIAVDYITLTFFDEENLSNHTLVEPRPLKTLYIESSGMLGTSTRLDPIDLAVALNDDRLPCLKNIRCTAKLGWDPKSQYVEFIVDALDERGGGIYVGY